MRIPSPMSEKLPTTMTMAAVVQLAAVSSTWKNGSENTMIRLVRTRAWSTPNTAVPTR